MEYKPERTGERSSTARPTGKAEGLAAHHSEGAQKPLRSEMRRVESLLFQVMWITSSRQCVNVGNHRFEVRAPMFRA